jgi:hypothetical protein
MAEIKALKKDSIHRICSGTLYPNAPMHTIQRDLQRMDDRVVDDPATSTAAVRRYVSGRYLQGRSWLTW